MEPLYIYSITVAASANARASIEVLMANDPATAPASGSAALVASLRRALDTRVRLLSSRLEPPFKRRPPTVAVVTALPRDSCFGPTASRRVPSGAAHMRVCSVGRHPAQSLMTYRHVLKMLVLLTSCLGTCHHDCVCL